MGFPKVFNTAPDDCDWRTDSNPPIYLHFQTLKYSRLQYGYLQAA